MLLCVTCICPEIRIKVIDDLRIRSLTLTSAGRQTLVKSLLIRTIITRVLLVSSTSLAAAGNNWWTYAAVTDVLERKKYSRRLFDPLFVAVSFTQRQAVRHVSRDLYPTHGYINEFTVRS